MKVKQLNRPLFELPSSHAARQFLEAFIECRRNCGGRELSFGDSGETPVDQEWISAAKKGSYRFSSFAYEYISFEVVLDGWLSNAPAITKSERGMLEQIAQMRALLKECCDACVTAGNQRVLTMARQVTEMLALWETCITCRLESANGQFSSE